MKTFTTPEGTFNVAGCWATLVNIRKNIPVYLPDNSTIRYRAVASIFFDLTLAVTRGLWQQKAKEVTVLETPTMHTDAEVGAVAWTKISEAIAQAKSEWAGYPA